MGGYVITKIRTPFSTTSLQTLNLYVDGFNLYFGLAEFGRKYKWLDLRAVAQQLCNPGQQVGTVTYFTARIRGNDSRKIKRQTTYLEALETTGVQIVLGKFLFKEVRCRKCGRVYQVPEEKESDVNLATHLLVDAAAGEADTFMVITADSDLILPMEKARDVYGRKVVPVFPPHRTSREIIKRMGRPYYLNESLLRNCQLPRAIEKDDGYTLYRPKEW